MECTLFDFETDKRRFKSVTFSSDSSIFKVVHIPVTILRITLNRSNSEILSISRKMVFLRRYNAAKAHMEHDTNKSFGTVIRDDISDILLAL